MPLNDDSDSHAYRQLLDVERSLGESEGDPEALLKRLHHAMEAHASRTLPSATHRGGLRSRAVTYGPCNRWYAVAAAVLVMAMAAPLWYIVRPIPGHLYATSSGQQEAIALRDGTHITLGPATRLYVPADFGRGTRSLRLDGEALFHVVHNARQPFVVHTAYSDIRDIGTVFDVRAYTVDHEARVAVAEGEVSVQGIALRPTDEVALDGAGQWTFYHHVDLAPFVDWEQGQLAFDNTPLSEVVRTLSRRFDLDITIADSTLTNVHVTERFTNQDIETILKDIAFVTSAEFERTGHRVVIRRAKAPPTGVMPDHAVPPVLNTVMTNHQGE